MNRLFSFISVFLLSMPASAEEKQPYPGAEKPSCLAQPSNLSQSSSAWKKGLEKASGALKRGVFEEGSVWDQKVLEKRHKLKKALEEFLEGKRGASVKKLDLAGTHPEKIHEMLLAKGFTHMREPLSAGLSKRKMRYWKRDGSYSSDRQEAGLVPHDIYTHPDGGLVRVKPEGVPNPRYPHPEPSCSKSVLLSLELKYHHHLRKEVPQTSYRNEAFKVSLKGQPIPKGPNPQFGLKLLYPKDRLSQDSGEDSLREEQKGWIDGIIQAGHLPLPADFSHCKKSGSS